MSDPSQPLWFSCNKIIELIILALFSHAFPTVQYYKCVGEIQRLQKAVVVALIYITDRMSQSVFFFFAEQWVKKMEEYRGWFKEQELVKTDESKRPGKPKTHDDLFGLEGSFRQLVID